MRKIIGLLTLPILLVILWYILDTVDSPISGFIGIAGTSIGALIAIIGNTWDNTQKGLQKIKLTGFISLYVVAVSTIVSAHTEYKKISTNEWRRERMCSRTGQAILKLMSPYKLFSTVNLNEDYPALILELYKEKSFREKLQKLDLMGTSNLKGIDPNKTFDTQTLKPFLKGPWHLIFQQNTIEGILELGRISSFYEGVMDDIEIALIDDLSFNAWVLPLMTLETQAKGEWGISIPDGF